MAESNGSWRTWLLGALFTIVMATVAMVGTAQQRIAAEQDRRLVALEQVAVVNRERLVAAEQQVIAINTSLDRIEETVKETNRLLLQHMKVVR